MQNRILGLLLSLSLLPLQGCMLGHAGSCGDDDCDHHARDEDDVATRVPAALVGQWYAGAGGVTSPYDPATGAWGTPTGQGLLYALSADGSFTKGFQSFVSSGGCTTGYTAASHGRLLIAPERFTTRPERGTFMYRDSCAPSLNSDAPLDDLSEETFDWAIVPNELDPSLPMLRLRRTDGAEGLFRRL